MSMSEEMKKDIEETKAEASSEAVEAKAAEESTRATDVSAQEADVVEKKKKGPLFAIIATVVFLVILVGTILAVLFATGKLGSSKKTKPDMSDKFLTDTNYDITTLSYEELIQIAEKALEDGDYDKAIECYEMALKKDEMSADAYLGLVEVYIRTGDFDKAFETAKKGYEKTGDQRLKDKMDMIEDGNIVDSRGLYYKQTFYDGDNVVTGWFEFTYDKDGIQTSVTGYGADGAVKGYVDLISDEPDVYIYYWYGIDGSVGKDIRKVDSEGREIEKHSYDADGNLQHYSTYEYDGERTIETEYMSTGEVSQRFIRYKEGNKSITEYYSYENGEFVLFIKQIQEGNTQYYYDANGNLEHYTVEEYDEDGNPVGFTDYDADGNVQHSLRPE